MNLKRAIVILASFLLASCSGGNSSDYTHYNLERNFIGHPANTFFHTYGFPIARFEQGYGGITYWWASTQMDTAPKSAHLSSYASDKENYQIVDSYKGTLARQYCELRIYVDHEDIIRRIAIAVDSVGKFSESRCSELF